MQSQRLRTYLLACKDRGITTLNIRTLRDRLRRNAAFMGQSKLHLTLKNIIINDLSDICTLDNVTITLKD